MSFCLSLLQGFPEGHPSLQLPRACHPRKGRDKRDTRVVWPLGTRPTTSECALQEHPAPVLNAGEAEGLKAVVLKSLEGGAHLLSATVSCGSEMGQPGKLREPTISGVGS